MCTGYHDARRRQVRITVGGCPSSKAPKDTSDQLSNYDESARRGKTQEQGYGCAGRGAGENAESTVEGASVDQSTRKCVDSPASSHPAHLGGFVDNIWLTILWTRRKPTSLVIVPSVVTSDRVGKVTDRARDGLSPTTESRGSVHTVMRRARRRPSRLPLVGTIQTNKQTKQTHAHRQTDTHTYKIYTAVRHDY